MIFVAALVQLDGAISTPQRERRSCEIGVERGPDQRTDRTVKGQGETLDHPTTRDIPNDCESVIPCSTSAAVERDSLIRTTAKK